MNRSPWLGGGKNTEKNENPQTKGGRRKVECVELSLNYEYRRAYSELQLLDALSLEDLKDGKCYSFITGGDVDALSYLRLVLRHKRKLSHVIASTWCMSAEDVLQFKMWLQEGVIERLDLYVGEIFPSSYKVEWAMLKEMYQTLGCGRLVVFRNHSKIFAGCAEDFYFGIQTSANINTNPRTENGCIIVSREIYEFYKSFFDGINSFL